MAIWPTWYTVRFTWVFFFSVFRNSFFFLLIHFQHSVLPISKTALIQATSSPLTANFDRHFHFSYLISSEHLTLDLFLLQTFSCLWRAHFSSLSFRLCVTFPYTPCFLLVLKSCSSSWPVMDPLSLPALECDLMLPTAFNAICMFNPTVDLQPIPITEFQNHTFKFLSSISFWMFHE